MLTCIYNGKEMNFDDFIENSVNNKEIVDKKLHLRKLSDNSELHCKGCGAEVRFVDTEKKAKHFRHLKSSECTYDKFSNDHKYSEDIRQKFYNEIDKTIPGYEIFLDKRLEDGTWVDIAFVFDNKTTVALNFINRSFKETKMKEQHEKFKEMGVVDLWIIIGEPSSIDFFEDMYTKDAMLLQDDWQNLVLYASESESETESENELNPLTVRYKTIYKARIHRQKFHYESMPISAFSVNESGKIPYIEKIIEQKNTEIEKDNELYNEEQRKKQEELERRMLEAAEEEKKRLAKLAEVKQEEIKKKENVLKRKEDSVAELHQRTGMFIGSKIKGEYELIPLEEIKLPKTLIQMMPYTRELFEEKLNKAFIGYAAPIKELMIKLAQCSNEEKDIYLDLMKPYRELPKDDEKFRILAQISIQSALVNYIENSYIEEFRQKIKNSLNRNNIEVNEEQLIRFLKKNKSWIKNNYVAGRDDHIMIAKYKKS